MIEILIILFVIGYLVIALEQVIKIDKAAIALLFGVISWVVYILGAADNNSVLQQLMEHIASIASILFFLLGAMTIVELIDAHDGFQIIAEKITSKKKTILLWIIATITFFLSALIDNLTATIVMISIVRKLVNDRNDKLIFAGIIVIASNAGGAWSPIGDVTTTMLWIGNQITPLKTVMQVFLPSVVCLLIPLVILSFTLKGTIEPTVSVANEKYTTTKKERIFVLFIGLFCILLVPIFKISTHLPPFMGILFSLSCMWIITEIIHFKKQHESKEELSVLKALQKIDTPSILFFLGILLSIACLQSSGILTTFAHTISTTIANKNVVVLCIGLLSSIVDNVPLVAAVQGMYPLQEIATDNYFWQFLCYACGTGGSCLIIGSAAGVAAMGIEKISFIWYLKNISWLALLGFLAGGLVFIVQQSI